MTYLGRIFRCLPMYYHLVDCIYWHLSPTTFYTEQHCPREREPRAEKCSGYFAFIWLMVPPRLEEANLWNLVTGLASVNNLRSYQTTESLISDITIVWIGIINLHFLFLRCSYYCLKAVPFLRRLVACISLRRPGFDLTQIRVTYMVDKVAMEEILLRVLPLSRSLPFVLTITSSSLQYRFSEPRLFEVLFRPSRCPVVKVIPMLDTEFRWSCSLHYIKQQIRDDTDRRSAPKKRAWLCKNDRNFKGRLVVRLFVAS